MINDYQKIDLDLTGIDLVDTNSGVVLHKPRDLDFVYHKIKDEYVDILTERLPQMYRDQLYMIVYLIIGGPHDYHPHIDNVGFSAINYYHIAGEGITSFYKLKDTFTKYVSIDGIEFEGWYDINDVELVSSFTPKDNECYIINTSSIHDVRMLTNTSRHCIQYIYNRHL